MKLFKNNDMSNREIKFRAYCNTDDGLEMVYFGKLECDNGLWFDAPKHIDEYSDKIMQFTGLKDKNGNEIYEGDIISVKERHASFPLKWIVVYNDKQLGFRLRWEQRFVSKESGFYDILPTPSKYEQFEIIGNIYENPGLLKQPVTP